MIWSGLAKDFPSKDFKDIYYVYALKENLFEEPFYIGKGKAQRAKGHKYSGNNRLKLKLESLTYSHFVEILSYSKDEKTIFALEKHFISKYDLVDFGGSLLNLVSGSHENKSAEKEFYSIPENRLKRQLKFAKLSGKAVFVDGFIFPSKRLAVKAMGLTRTSIKFLLKIGRAWAIEEDYKEKEAFYIKYVEECGIEYQKRLSALKPGHFASKRVMVDGQIFNSLGEGDLFLGLSRGTLSLRISRGNQKNTYLI